MADFSGYSYRTKVRKINAKVEEHMRTVEIQSEFEEPLIEAGPLNVPIPVESDEPKLFAVEYGIEDDISFVEDYFSYVDETENEDYYSYGEGSDDDSEDDKSFNLREELACWAIQYNISHAALAALLQILQKCGLDLPKDPRTLLRTPTHYTIQEIAGGSYCHVGLENNIRSLLDSM